MIYTDSKYAFGIVCTFGKIWMERGLINSKGRDIVHKELIIQVLDNLMMPEEIAIAHVKGGNRLADEAAREAAQQSEIPIFTLVPVLPPLEAIPKFSPDEEEVHIGGSCEE